jgi:spore germination protein GerM
MPEKSQKEKALEYYYKNVEKYREYYQKNKTRIIEYQKAHNKAIRSGSRAPQSRKQSQFKIEYRQIVWTPY